MLSGYKSVPLNIQTDSMGWHGNAILVRKDAEIGVHDVLHLPYLEPRGATMAEITAKDITVRRTQKKVLMKHGPRTE